MKYKVPADMNIKEKIIGGILTINQFGWLMLGLLIGGGVFACTFKLLGGVPAIICGLLFVPLGIPFAFYKKNELTLFRYLYLKREFKKKNKKLIYQRKIKEKEVI